MSMQRQLLAISAFLCVVSAHAAPAERMGAYHGKIKVKKYDVVSGARTNLRGDVTVTLGAGSAFGFAYSYKDGSHTITITDADPFGRADVGQTHGSLQLFIGVANVYGTIPIHFDDHGDMTGSFQYLANGELREATFKAKKEIP